MEVITIKTLEGQMAFFLVSQESVVLKTKNVLYAISKLLGFIKVVFLLVIITEIVLKICKIGYSADWQWYVLHIFFVLLVFVLFYFYLFKKIIVIMASRDLIVPKDLQNFILFLFDRETRKYWKKLKAEYLWEKIKW